MTKFKYLANYSGSYTLDNGKSGVAFYVVAVKDGNCKPLVMKCSQDVFNETSKLKGGETLNLYFDERQRITGINIL